ncbi:MAG: carboxypeptidase regulatory-like domain-containing protein [Aeromicrobium erythreum]
MPTRRIRARWGVVVALGLALLLTNAPAAQADAAYTATVTVLDENDNPVEGATVGLYDPDADEDGAALASALTNSSGVATFPDQPAGDYLMKAWKSGYRDQVGYVATLDETQTDLGPLYLERLYGTVSGTVINEDGDAYDCAIVRAYRTGQDESGEAESSGSDYTNDDGEYSLSLPTGSYKLRVSDDCDDRPAVWVGPAGSTYGTADTITVDEDGTTVAPVQLRNGARVLGTVSGPDGVKLKDVRVVAVTAGSDPEDAETIASATTTAAGTYVLRKLPAGTYDLRFTDPLGEYQGDKIAAVNVGTADVTGQNITLAKLPASEDPNLLKGKVTGPDKAGIGGITVSAYGDGGPYDTLTRRDGTWSLNVESGSYRIRFDDNRDDEDQQYLGEWFDDAPTYDKAKTVVVGSTAVTANAQLSKLGSLSGTVSTPGTWDDTYFYVELYDADGERVGSTSADRDGRYEFTRVVPGRYTVKASGDVSNDETGGQLVRQFYVKAFSLGSATAITVGDGAAVTGRNLSLSRQLSNVSAPKVTGKAAKGKTLTGSAGSWSLTVDTQHAYQWYRGSSKISGATKSTYKAGSSDVGKQLKVCVVASNRYDRYPPEQGRLLQGDREGRQEVGRSSILGEGSAPAGADPSSVRRPGQDERTTSGRWLLDDQVDDRPRRPSVVPTVSTSGAGRARPGGPP